MQNLTQGANAPLPAGTVIRLRLTWSPERIGGLDVDASAFLLRADGKVASDDGMIFYNQCRSSDGCLTLENGVFLFDPNKAPADLNRIAFAVTIHGFEGSGVSFKGAAIAIEAEGTARYAADTAAMTETALIVGEIYRRNSDWKIRAVGQGFTGGLAPLARHFGVSVDEEPAAPPAKVDLAKRLISLEKTDPELVSLVKKVQVSLEKKALPFDKAKVALVLDISASMDHLFSSGKIDHLVQRIMALGYRFDDDGSIDVFLFGLGAHAYGALDTSSYKTFVRDMRRTHRLEGGTYYGKVMRMVRDHYAAQPDARDIPVYVMFVTDGGTGDPRLSETMIKEASAEPIFWSFMAIGPKPKGGKAARSSKRLPSGFDFLAYLDDMPGRVIDNANFFSVEHPADPTDEELFDLLMEEYPRWLNEAMSKGILRRH